MNDVASIEPRGCVQAPLEDKDTDTWLGGRGARLSARIGDLEAKYPKEGRMKSQWTDIR